MSKFYPAILSRSKVFLIGLSFLLLPGGAILAQISQTFTSSGTFTVPAGVTTIKVEAWGGGAGGSTGYGGGGGGAFAGSNALTVIPGTTYTVTVGNGGAALNNGGNSSFGTLIIANGGGNVNGTSGNLGGTVAKSTGAVRYAGGNGANGTGRGGGGGGGSAGAGGAGGNGGNSGNDNAGLGGVGGLAGTGTGGAAGGNGGSRYIGGIPGNVPGGGGGENGSSGAGSAAGGKGMVIVTYTPPYLAEFTAMNTGAAAWCAGETRNITVTVKNAGAASWTSGPINFSYWWSNQGQDTNPRLTPFSNLAPGQSQTITVPVTATTAGTHTLNFDLVYEGNSWFRDNGGAIPVGPGNVIFTSPNIVINVLPSAPLATSPQNFCGTGTVANLTATGTTIKWFAAAIGGAPLAASTVLVDGTHYYASQTNASGCESSTRRDVTVTINTPAIPTGTAAQSFCAIDNKKFSDIVVTGTAIKWYTAATGGTLIPNTNTLTSGTYYASQTISGCESASRLAVTVTVDDPAAPTGAATQNFCLINAPKVSDLVATGTNVKWYSVATGGTALATNTTLATNTYYASQTIGGCESATRMPVAVTVGNPAAPTGAATQTFCASDNPTVANLSATGTTIQWYDAATGGTLLNNTTPLVNNTRYYASQTISGCESATRLNVLVTVNAAVVIGTQPNPSQTKCVSSSVTFTAGASNAAGYQWYFGSTPLADDGNITGSQTATLKILETVQADAGLYHVVITGRTACGDATSDNAELLINENLLITDQPDAQTLCVGANATFTVVSGGTSLMYKWRKGSAFIDAVANPSAETSVLTIPNITVADAGSYSVLVSDGAGVGCTERYSTAAMLTVNATSVGGTVNGSIEKCSGINSGSLTLAGKVGNVDNWEYSLDGTSWTAFSPVNTTTTQAYSNLTQTTYYRAKVTSGVCDAVYSTTGIITVNELPTITTSANAGEVCFSTVAQTTSLNYSATTNAPTTYSITWSGTFAAVTNATLNPGAITINVPANAPAGTYTGTLTVKNANGCTSTPATTFTVTVNPLPTITTDATAADVCFSTSAQNTTLAYTATTNTPTNYSITWNAAAISAGLVNVNSTALGASPITIPVAASVAAGTYTGTINVTNAKGCASVNKTFTLKINPLPTITPAASAATACFGATSTTLNYTSTNTPTTYSIVWSSTPSNTFVNVANAALPAIPVTIAIPSGTLAGTYTGTLTVKNANGCESSSGTNFTVSVLPELNYGTLTNANETICSGGDPSGITLSTAPSGGAGTFTYQWYSKAGANACPTGTNTTGWTSLGSANGAQTATYDPPAGITGTTTYALQVNATGTPDCSGGTWASGCRTVTVNAAVNFGTLTSGDQTICYGDDPGNITFSTAASGGAGTFTYQWYYKDGVSDACPTGTSTSGWTLISGATGTSYDPPSGSIVSRTYAVQVDPTGTQDCGVATWATGCRKITVRPELNFGTLAAGNEAVCFGGDPANITMSAAASGGSGTFTYQWYYKDGLETCPTGTSTTGWNLISGATSSSYNPPAGLNVSRTYALQVNPTGTPDCAGATWANGCRQVTVNPLPGAGNISGSNTVCITSQITLIPNATGTAPFTYTWASSSSGVVTVTNAGVVTGVVTGSRQITYTVKDANGCSQTSAPFTVTVTKPTAGNITGTETSLCMDQTIALVSYGSGVAPLTVTWSSSNNAKATVDNNGIVTGVSAGTANITYTVTDANGCSTTSASYAVTIVQIPTGTFTATETSGLVNNDNIVCAGATVKFTAPAGYGSYIFINGLDTLQKGTSNIFNVSTLPLGVSSIRVNVANNLNCAVTFGPIDITVTPLPTPTLTAAKTTICAGESITFTATGGATGTKYNFKVNNATVQNSTSNTYTSTIWTNNDKVTVEVTNENNCAATSSEVTIAVNPLPTGTFTSTDPTVCAGEKITFTATGGSQYQFSVGGTVAQAFSGTNTFSSNSLLNGDVVTVEVKNETGCIGTFPAYPAIPVTINPLPTGSLVVTENSGTPNDLSICANAPVTYIFPTGYKNYDFRVNGVSEQSSASNIYINSSLVAGDEVTVIVSTNSNCTATFDADEVTIAPSPTGTLTNNVTNNTICAGETVLFTASPGFANYNFKINGSQASVGTTNTFQTNLLIDGDVVTVEVTNANSCVTVFNSITMTVTALPTGTMTITETSGVANDDGITCTGAEVIFTAPAGFTNYNFLLNGSSVQNGGSATYTNNALTTGNKMTVAVTNAGGCIALLNEFIMIVNPLPTVAAITGAAEICAEGNITLSNVTTGGKWTSSNEGIATVNETTGVVTGVSAGTVNILYTVTNTTTNCSNIATKSITINALPVVASITGDLNVCIGSSTTLSNATSGGIWTSDNTGVATIDASGNVIGVSNGTANISYTVTNAKGCITVETVVMNVHALPVVAAIAGKLDVCINATTTLTNTTSVGAWTSSNPLIATVNSSTGVVTGVAQGSVVISYTVTNSNNCVTTVTENLIVNSLPFPFLDGPNPICPNSTETYTTQPGQNNYTWTQTGGTIQTGGGTTDNKITITWDQPGARTIYVNYTDANGCSGANSATLETSTGTIPELDGDLTVCLNNSDGSYISQSGFTNYVWTATNGTVTPGTGSNEHTATVNWTASGNQTITVNFMDLNGCVAAAPTVRTVLVNPLPTATVTTNKTEVCQDGTPPVITFTGANGLKPYTFTYTINGGAPLNATTSFSQITVTVTVPTATPGAYEYKLVSVLSNNTCTQLQNGAATVTVTPTPSATISYGASPVCKSAGPITVTHTGTPGGTYTSAAGLTINATTGEITPSTSTPGTYTVTYRVAAAGGCAVYTTTTSVIITAAPAATITYSGAPFCTTATPKNVTRTGTAGGSFSSTTGLSIDATTGQITPATSTPGTYTVTYTIAAAGGCGIVTVTADVTITAAPSATIAYSASPYCTSAGTASVTRTGTAGGSYTATPAGLSINAATGAIDLAASTGGTYTVTYSVGASGGCAAISTTASVVVNPAPTAQAGTTAVLTCANSGAVNITAGSSATNYSTVQWTSSGTGTIANGNSINAATYNPSAADITAGSVTLMLRANGNAGCTFVTSSKTMTISAVPAAFLIEPASATLCEGDVQTLSASGGVSGIGSMTFNSSGGNNNKAIGNPGNTTSTINITGLPAGATVTSVDVKFNISHGYAGELVLNLKAPNGNILNLVNQKGGSGDNFNTTISSTATNNINGNAPFNSVYRADRVMNVGAPQSSNVNTFNQLLGTMAGNWVLSAQDIIGCRAPFFGICFGGNYDGKINNWSITVNYNVPVDPLNVTWSPLTDLYTDIETTIPYAGQDLSTVYAMPTPGTATYTATQTNASGCSTTETVNLVTNSTPVVKITADYCEVPGFVRLTASSTPAASSYLWSNGATTAVIEVDESGTYEVQAFVSGSSCPGEASIGVSNELVINGDFEQGDIRDESGISGFNTAYTSHTGSYYDGGNGSGLYPEGYYAIDKSANSPSNGVGYHPRFYGRDHTSGAGNFMMVNGSVNVRTIWEQTVNVLPNTDYYFSAWAMNLHPDNPARLQFEINGVAHGSVAELNSAPKPQSDGQIGISNWVRFYSDPTWKSGPTTTTAIIRIINLSTAQGGNDFGLDDISFGTLSTFIQLVSAPGTDAQTVCKNSAIDNILYNVGNGSAAGPSVTGLPSGVTSSFDGDRLTISGTPTVAGNYTYTITTTGCGATTATGTITVEEQKIVLSAGNTAPVCKDAPMMDRVYTLSGTAISASVTTLPAGVIGTLSGTTFTISGTPTVTAGVYPYTITTTGTCEPVSIAGNITVQEQTIDLNSAIATTTQTVCINTGITNIQYLVGGTGTGAGVTGLPTGVTGKYVAGVYTISGIPTVSGTFTYTITTTGPCGAVTATGTINVTPAATITLSSASGTDAQVACNNLPITPITYAVNNATGASITGGALPAGITGSFAGGIFTISGSTAQTGVFNYTITTSGGCASATISGKITVNGQKIVLTSGAASPSVCANAPMTDIMFTISGEATGASISGQPAGVTGTLSGKTFTVNGIPTAAAGSYPYTITTSGPNCDPATITGTITVQPTAIGGTIANASTCSGGNGTLTVVGHSGTSITWQVSLDGGATWNNVSPVNKTISLNFTNLTAARLYRVEVSNKCGAVYSTEALVGVHNLWTGAVDTDWQKAANWSDHQLPDMTCPNVYIPNTTNKPILANGSATIRNIYIDAGAILTVNGTGALQIAGTINNSGTFDASEGEIEFNGTTAQNIVSGTFVNNAVKDLKVSNATGVNLNHELDVYGSLTFGSTNAILNTIGNLTLKSNINNTAWVGQMTTSHIINGEVTVERFINTGTNENPGAHRKSWQLLAVPTNGSQTIHEAWQEGATAPINPTTPNQNTAGNPNPGYGTMIVSNAGGPTGAIGRGFDQYTAPGPSIKAWDPTGEDYVGPQNTTSTSIYNIKGYLVLVRGDRSVYTHDAAAKPTTLRSKGTLFTPSSLPPSSSVPAGKFESVGNPYASAIDLRKLTSSGGLVQSISVWDPRAQGAYSLGAFTTLTKDLLDGNFYATPGSTSYPGTTTAYNIIESGQAFFIQATGSAGSIFFDEDAKVSGSNPQLLRGQSGPGRQSQLRTNLFVGIGTNMTLADGTLIQYDATYSNTVDGLDARKMTNTSENLGLRSGGKLLVVERRGPIVDIDTVFYQISGMRVQPYKFEFLATDLGEFGVEGVIEDNYLGIKTSLNMEGKTEYSFTIENKPGSYASDRFRIVFKAAAGPLPVTFVSLKAAQQGDDIAVDWKVENETNMKDYEVEKSLDGVRFVRTSLVPAGNDGAGAYTWLDKDVTPGWNYYRIKSLDENGKVSYSEVAKVLVEMIAPMITVYPNPIVNGVINVHLVNQPAGNYKLRLLNAQGQVMVNKLITRDKGTSIEPLTWDYKLARGNYRIEVTKPDGGVKVITVIY